jgi:hypothetical protein
VAATLGVAEWSSVELGCVAMLLLILVLVLVLSLSLVLVRAKGVWPSSAMAYSSHHQRSLQPQQTPSPSLGPAQDRGLCHHHGRTRRHSRLMSPVDGGEPETNIGVAGHGEEW